MSIRIMSQVWNMEIDDSTTKKEKLGAKNGKAIFANNKKKDFYSK